MKKFECVGHAQKRMGNRHLALKKTKLTDDIGRRMQWEGTGGGGGEGTVSPKIPFYFCRSIIGKRLVQCE